MAFDPIETGGRRLDWCLQLSEETRRVLEEEGGIDHHFMDQGIERETRDLTSKSSQSSNSTVENKESGTEREDKNQLMYAITGLLVVYALQNLGVDAWILFSDVLTRVYGLPSFAAFAISFGLLQGMTNILGFLGGNLADAYTGRMEMVFISLGLKIMGGVCVFASAFVGDGLFDDDDDAAVSDMVVAIPYTSSSSFNSAIFIIIGIVLLCISGVGESSLEVLVGDQFALSPDPKQQALGTLGWDIFVVVRYTSGLWRFLLYWILLYTYPEPMWSLPYLIFPTVAILLLLILKYTGVIRCVEPQGPRLGKVFYGIRLLMKKSGATEGSGSASEKSDSKVIYGRSTAFNMSDKTILQSPSVEKNSEGCDDRVVAASEGSALPTRRLPISRTTTLQRIQEPVDKALMNDIRQILRMALVVAPPCVIYYGITGFVSNCTMHLIVHDLYVDRNTKDHLRKDLLTQFFVIPIVIIVVLALLHFCSPRREGMGIFPLTKILIGLSTGVLYLISVIVLDALFLYCGYILPAAGVLVQTTLPRVGDALVMVGAVQFLFSHSPPFLRCSAMGLILFAMGLGYILSTGFNAILGGVLRLPTQNDGDIRIIFHAVLIVCLCLSMGYLYFTKRWYESLRSHH